MERTPAGVYAALAPAVAGYFRGQGIRDADDLTGDVFVSVAKGLPGFRGDDDALRRWVFTIAHNRLVDEYRRRGRDLEIAVAEVPEAPSEDAPPPDPELLDALGSLTDDQREVITLRFIADLPLKDVARIVSKRTGAVKMLQARGLDALRAALRDEP